VRRDRDPVSCGAAATTPVIQVTNLARAMKKLQELGMWLVRTDDTAPKTIHDRSPWIDRVGHRVPRAPE